MIYASCFAIKVSLDRERRQAYNLDLLQAGHVVDIRTRLKSKVTTMVTEYQI